MCQVTKPSPTTFVLSTASELAFAQDSDKEVTTQEREGFPENLCVTLGLPSRFPKPFRSSGRLRPPAAHAVLHPQHRMAVFTSNVLSCVPIWNLENVLSAVTSPKN